MSVGVDHRSELALDDFFGLAGFTLRDSQFFDGASKSIPPSCFLYACPLDEVGEAIYVITINTDYHGEIKSRGIHAGVSLGDTRVVEERRFSGVAGFRVDFHSRRSLSMTSDYTAA